MKKLICLLVLFGFFHSTLFAQTIISEKKEARSFPLSTPAQQPVVVVDDNDDSLVQKAATLFQTDVEMVSGKKPQLSTALPSAKNIVLVGSLGKSRFIQQLVQAKKINVDSLQNKWEGYQVQVVNNPFKGIAQALVITGSDRRGTAYGVFELSKQIGVSPWWWWADVPVKKKAAIYVKQSAFLTDAPKVKYRGIFINDEAPALSSWSKEKFGGFNHRFYEKVFELILRLKGNYLWPAMWGNAFNDDDKLNPVLANQWGIVMGTSHHEPMLRAQQEWKRFGHGAWDYTKNDTALRAFWRKGIENMGQHESIVTIGMRGDGDEPMTQGTATALLERIVADQRRIIEDVTRKPASETPQLWALYKEVQDYYDKGMRVPDDVTLLLCDDNWGNLRKLPKLTDKPRSGGYGIYYHFDYVGGPRNYKWINTNNLPRVWEQMHLAYEHGVKNIWIVNVGDIKPMELPTSFFLDYAWNPEGWTEDNLRTYYTQWASQQFGPAQAKEIGDVLRRYSQYSARRKPELLDAKTYNLTNYNEWENVTAQWNQLAAEAEKLNNRLPASDRDAFFQLVLHPAKAFDNLHQLYFAVALNRANAKDSNLSANKYADWAKQLYKNDSLLSLRYHQLGNGKWNHMMAQTHIGYTYWQQPDVNTMPAVTYVTDGNITDTALNPGYKIPSAKHLIPANSKGRLFYEQNGYVSIEAEHWTRAVNTANIKWKAIPDIGRDGSSITTFPVTTASQLSAASPHVEYDFYTEKSDSAKVNLLFSPTLNFYNTEEGLQFAVSIDNEQPQIISLNKEDKNSISGIWNKWVAENIIVKTSKHTINKPGRHTLKYWVISPGVVLQKLVIDLGGLKPSYLGPQETIFQQD